MPVKKWKKLKKKSRVPAPIINGHKYLDMTREMFIYLPNAKWSDFGKDERIEKNLANKEEYISVLTYEE